MPNRPEQVAARIREMREILEMSREQVAIELDLEPELYARYETGEMSVPISTLYALAKIFSVDFTVLLTGDTPRMGDYTLVRAGGGVGVDRYPGYSYESLAFNYIGRTMEPMIVALQCDGQPVDPVTHGGQEFNLVLEGKVKLNIGTHEFILGVGDSCYFNPRIPHAQRAYQGPAKFLTVIQK